jgi:hypothetical protein
MNQPTSNGNLHGLIDHSHFVGRTRVAYFFHGSRDISGNADL